MIFLDALDALFIIYCWSLFVFPDVPPVLTSSSVGLYENVGDRKLKYQ